MNRWTAARFRIGIVSKTMADPDAMLQIIFKTTCNGLNGVGCGCGASARNERLYDTIQQKAMQHDTPHSRIHRNQVSPRDFSYRSGAQRLSSYFAINIQDMTSRTKPLAHFSRRFTQLNSMQFNSILLSNTPPSHGLYPLLLLPLLLLLLSLLLLICVLSSSTRNRLKNDQQRTDYIATVAGGVCLPTHSVGPSWCSPFDCAGDCSASDGRDEPH